MAAKIPPIAERKPVYKTLPIGEVRFSHLDKPDTTFCDDEHEGTFNITMAYTPEEIAAFQSELQTLADGWLEEVKGKPRGKGVKLNALPIKKDKDREGNETGLVRVSCSTKAYRKSRDPETGKPKFELRPVPIFDNSNPPQPVAGVRCYGGSIARPSVTVSFYASPNPKIGVGVSLGLNAVQVIKASGGVRSAAGYGFGHEEQETSDVSTAEDTEDAPETEYTEAQDM